MPPSQSSGLRSPLDRCLSPCPRVTLPTCPLATRCVASRSTLAVRADVDGLDDADVAVREGGLAVAEVETPLADEAFVEAHGAHLVELGFEGLAPGVERAGVVATELFEAVELEAALLGHEVADAVDRKQERAGEDVLLDEVHAVAELRVTAVGAGDVLEGGDAVGLEQAADRGAEGRQVLMAEGFHHLDGDALIVRALVVAEVLELDGDAVREAGGLDAFDGEVVLGLRDGERGDAAAVLLDGVQGPAAPAGADLDDVVRRLELEEAAEGIVLVGLRLLEGVRTFPAGRGVHHRRVEEEAEEVVGDVVVLRDIAAHHLLVIRTQEVADAVGDAEEPDADGLAGRAGHARGLVDVLDEEADERVEVRGVPFALHVAFGQADVGGQHDATEGVLVADFHAGAAGRARVAEHELRAFGQAEDQASFGELRELGEDEAAGKGAGGGGGVSHVGRSVQRWGAAGCAAGECRLPCGGKEVFSPTTARRRGGGSRR